MNEFEYISPEIEVDRELTIRRSRFIACVRKVQAPKEISSLLVRIKQQYPSATHYCWAYRIGLRQPEEHSNDDGEPAGTAGKPILNIMKRHRVLQTSIIVVRYYGGVKLGTGGLIEAYSGSAEQALLEAHPILHEETTQVLLECSYAAIDELRYGLTKLGVIEAGVAFEYRERVFGEINVPKSKLEATCSFLENLVGKYKEIQFSLE